MIQLYKGKLEIDEKEPWMFLYELEQGMRKKLKQFLEEELSLTEEGRQTFIRATGITILHKYYKKNSGNLLELKVNYDGRTYEHKLIGYGPSEAMTPLIEKIAKLYDGHEIKKEAGGKVKGFVKI